jgi:transcriptional regulator with XRE-family HTH domain
MKATTKRTSSSDLVTHLTALKAGPSTARPPVGGWLRAVRQELGLAQATVAQQAGLTQQAYAQFEQGETKGTLSLGNLQRSAAAMDCELVYFLVPRGDRAGSLGDLTTQPGKNPAPVQVAKTATPPAGQTASGDPSAGFTLNLVQDHSTL